MFLKVKDEDNDIIFINIKKILLFGGIENKNTQIQLQDGFFVEINKSVEEVEKRFFQLGIKVKEF